MFHIVLYRFKRVFHFFKTGLFQAFPAQIKHHFPEKKIKIIAITGTDGKTTSAMLLHHVLNQTGLKVGLISTVGTYVGSKLQPIGFHITAPQPKDLYSYLAKMVASGCEYVVLETTSHGLYQYRNWGIKPAIAGLTNVASEHLDYHRTKELYLEAKLLLFRRAKVSVLNADDESFQIINKSIPKNKIRSYSKNDSLPAIVTSAIMKKLPESYNQQNARLVFKICKELGVSATNFARALPSFAGVPGRVQWLKTKKPFSVVIDFAHTPQGLGAVLTALRKILKNNKQGRLIAVFGCAGLRDRQKRPIMGKIATELADLAIFTAEDPRTEDVWSIIRQMKENLDSGHDKIISIADRGEAIRFALKKIAQPGDNVAILGKGHEQSMCYGTTEVPWSDVEFATEILNEK
ncbi:MAG: hypothetical protein COY80_04450 [Candidatus Pacebacteria bacterium CG_4_10_14_0_8_um_filter_42_14]|nr:MAG: hypothetical protein COY80_04450 [Candidatus Pacebacteria bacterium CG_4_10_14_0_8_um_filter_42_14]